MDVEASLGCWLRQRRRSLGLTQEELAAQVQCAVVTIRKLETDERRPSKVLLTRLADRLGVALADLPALPEPPRRSMRVNALRQLEPGEELSPTPLLATKLYVPAIRLGRVPRSHLLARLDKGLDRFATVVTAPAGFGKTTLVVMWYETLRERHIPCAWLSLDASDNDPAQFWSYVGAALDPILPGVYDFTRTFVKSARPFTDQPLLVSLINRLSSGPHKVVLVLDDYHLIASAQIHQGLSFLLEHMPPQLHLVLVSRADLPISLARLRGRGQVEALHAPDLRFTPDEVATFLREVMGLQLARDDVAAIEARTEGWAVGLQLAALALQERKDRTEFIQSFTASNHYVVDYLATEVLDSLSPHLQHFVLQTAILERMSGSLCDAVVLHAPGAAANVVAHDSSPVVGRGSPLESCSHLILQELERANLFLVPLDNERRWYRYHHLFAEVLRTRLAATVSNEDIKTLHRRASIAFTQHGDLEQAIEHALTADDVERAAELVEQVWPTLFVQGALETLRRWLDALPRPAVLARPKLAIYTANVLALMGEWAAADHLLNAVEQALRAETTGTPGDLNDLRGRAAMVRAFIATLYDHDHQRAIAVGQQALDLLASDERYFRGVVYMVLGLAYQQRDELPAAEHAFGVAAQLGQAVGHLYVEMAALRRQAMVRMAQGMLRAAAGTCERMMARATTAGGQLPTSGYAHVGLAELLYQWNDLAEAQQHVETGIALGTQGGLRDLMLHGTVTLARIRLAQSDAPGAQAALQRALEVGGKETAAWVQMLVALAHARTGKLELAADLADEAMATATLHDSDLHTARTLALARIRLAQNRPHDVITQLEQLQPMVKAAGRKGNMVEILILQALAFDAEGDDERAMAALERAVVLAEPEGYVRSFLDEGQMLAGLLARWLDGQAAGTNNGTNRSPARAYAATLLAAFTPRQASVDPTGTPVLAVDGIALNNNGPAWQAGSASNLSEREREILCLVVRGLTNKQVAAQLSISPHTVNMHLRSIYDKLNVTTRVEATRLAVACRLV